MGRGVHGQPSDRVLKMYKRPVVDGPLRIHTSCALNHIIRRFSRLVLGDEHLPVSLHVAVDMSEEGTVWPSLWSKEESLSSFLWTYKGMLGISQAIRVSYFQ